MKPVPLETSPAKLLLEELHFLRQRLREILETYGGNLDAGIVQVREAVAAEASSRKKLTKARAHELRDMLGVLRTMDLKPEKGRRRDLKKIETATADLQRFVELW